MSCALERFFESHTHGVLWSVPHAVAVWRVAGAPPFYMMEPHACGPTGLRVDAQDDGAACVLTFTSAKLMAFA
ncbi:putative Hel [Danaus plexippus plexippus]|uniref:Hel n=1 Tax=Danaus plexippus plexippus TaxID=278856 RepID=A0A212FG63_DANPL|nr:putative Hel [Danaus plexippus plexippus]